MKLLRYIVIFISCLMMCSCDINIISTSANTYKEPVMLSFNELSFEVMECDIYNSEIDNGANIVIPIRIKNKTQETQIIKPTFFSLSNCKLILSNTLFYYESIELSSFNSQKIELLFHCSSIENIKDKIFEIDISFFKSGKTIALNEIKISNKIVTYEQFCLEKFNVEKNHVELMMNIIKNEELSMFDSVKKDFDSELNEYIYVISSIYGNFGVSINSDLSYSMYQIFDNGEIFIVYEDKIRNPYYVFNNVWYEHYLKQQEAIKAVLEAYYSKCEVDDFSYSRVSARENSFVVSATVTGVNAYGMVLTKVWDFYYDYNVASKEFDIYMIAIDNKIEMDKRIEVGFITNCDVKINNIKISKNYYVPDYSYKLKKDGYVFIGWKVRGDSKIYDFTYIPDDDFVLEAIWEKNDDII